MTEEKGLEAIRQIFDIGWACRLTPCYAEWLSKILRKQYWKISVLPFIKQIVEKKWKDDFGRTVCSCGYWKDIPDSGFKLQHIKKGCHQNLHQVIHCLNKYRGIPFEKISIERDFCGYQVDVLGEIDPEKYIVVELGQLSSYEKFWLIYDSILKEFWFDGQGEYFYSLRANGELPEEEHLLRYAFDFFVKKCSKNLGQLSDCSTYSREISRLCSIARNSFPEKRDWISLNRQ